MVRLFSAVLGVAVLLAAGADAATVELKPVGAAGLLPNDYVQADNPIGGYVPDQGEWRMVVEFDLGAVKDIAVDKAVLLFDSQPLFTPAATLDAAVIPGSGDVEGVDYDSAAKQPLGRVAGPSQGSESLACRVDLTEAVRKTLGGGGQYLAIRFYRADVDPRNPAAGARSVHNPRLVINPPQPTGGSLLVRTDAAIADHADANVEGSLAWAVGQLADAAGTVELPGSMTYAIGGDLTVPSNVCLRFGCGAVLAVAEGKTLTIDGCVEAGLWTIFAGKGKIAGEPKVEAIRPQWFGAKGDGQADDIEPLQKAVDYACTSRVLAVDLGRGRYRITRTLNGTNTREAGTIHRDGLRIFGASLIGTQIIGDTGDHHAIVETSGAQWLEMERVHLVAGGGNPSSIGIFTGCPKACPQSQNQIYHVVISLGDAMQQNGGLGSIGIWNYAAEEHTYRSLYIHANRPVVLWAFNGEKPDAPDHKGMFNYTNSYVELLNAPHSLGVVTFSGESFLQAVGKHAPVVTSHCANSLTMQGVYLGSVGSGANTCAFDVYGSLTNLTYSGTIEGPATFARVNGVLIGSRASATYGLVGEAQRTGLLYGDQTGAMDGTAPLLELGPAGRIENCDLTFTLEAQRERPLIGFGKPKDGGAPASRMTNTTVRTNQPTACLATPDALTATWANVVLSNGETKRVINERTAK